MPQGTCRCPADAQRMLLKKMTGVRHRLEMKMKQTQGGRDVTLTHSKCPLLECENEITGVIERKTENNWKWKDEQGRLLDEQKEETWKVVDRDYFDGISLQ